MPVPFLLLLTGSALLSTAIVLLNSTVGTALFGVVHYQHRQSTPATPATPATHHRKPAPSA
jgi:hypothetical protein